MQEGGTIAWTFLGSNSRQRRTTASEEYTISFDGGGTQGHGSDRSRQLQLMHVRLICSVQILDPCRIFHF